MIISPGRNYIFVHIPKTGGTSLALALEARAKKDDILIGDTPKARKRRHRLHGVEARGRLWKHSGLADIEGLVTRDFIAQAFCVTLVRNPWDRLVSLYQWLRAQSFDHPMVARAQAMPFDAFLRAGETRAALRANPYAAYMRDGTGRDRADLFIRLEHFEADARPLWSHLGFTLDLPHENRSDRVGDYRGYYDDALAAEVALICAEDIAQFGYSFDPPAAP
jgi:hypothetical protein